MMCAAYLVVLVFVWVGAVNADHPCAARKITGDSVVCVCNATYCDDIVRDAPTGNSFVAYTSSEAGSRFMKFKGDLKLSTSSSCCKTVLTIDVDDKFQTIEGFGGAVTDSAGINWKKMSEELQLSMVQSYFGANGLEYNMLRVPIGGSDFSTRPYAYNELPENDTQLTNFTLAFEDHQYKLPMIKEIIGAATSDVHIVATTWSPPKWMKTNKAWSGVSRLEDQYYQTYADYHLKFLEKYAAEGVSVWAITTTNEPINGYSTIVSFNSLGWLPSAMGKWLVGNLGPTIRNSSFRNVKILAMDDQRYSIPFWFNVMVKDYPDTLKYFDGVAFHYYGNILTPASILDDLNKAHPDKFILATESCQGSFPWDTPKVRLGSWARAKNYILDIISDLNHYAVGYIDWNLCLDAEGGPNWAKNYVDAPIIVFPESGEFVKQPMFYALGHISKFIPRGSVRIQVKEKKPLLQSSIKNVAVLTTRNTIVAVLYNGNSEGRDVAIRLGDQQAELQLEANSITSIEIPYNKSAET